MDSLDRLRDVGFERVGAWKLEPSGLIFVADIDVSATQVLYAFVSDREILYVGKTTRSLKSRLYGYRNPGPSQLTNIACNKKICGLLNKGGYVEVFARFAPKTELQIRMFKVNEAAALEDAIIHELNPPWNRIGKKKL